MKTADIMEQEKWVAQTNMFGLWVVGPEIDGLLSVLGMGRTLDEACEMAMRSKES